MGNNNVSNLFDESYNDYDTTVKCKLFTPIKKIERRKREVLLGEITLELLKGANQELSKEMERLMSSELQGIRKKIKEQEVIRKIEFIFENEVAEATKWSEKSLMQEFNTVIKLNLTTINKLIDVEHEESVSLEEISEKVVRLLDEEIKEENWYVLMAQQNQQLKYEISMLKEKWGKLFKKIEYKTNKRNLMFIKRKKVMREIIEREKNIIKKLKRT